MKGLTDSGFNYGSLESSDLAEKLKAKTEEGWRLIRDLEVASLVALGMFYRQAHEMLAGAGRDGKFIPWATAEFGHSKRQIYRVMAVAETFEEVAQNGTLPAQATALYELAEPQTPKNAIRDAKKLMKKKRLTVADAKRLKEKYTARPAPPWEEDEDDETDEVVESVDDPEDEEPDEMQILLEDCQATHRDAKAKIDSARRQMESLAEDNDYLRDVIGRITRDLKQAATTIYQMEPQEWDGDTLFTRSDVQSREG